ncbi:unnamed protein product [Pleuronectes platessa]|uniref:Uncharacterized protein n=1 Tax=Pleuronectes platessa TaxID=8262 RepID=A0A9N7ZEZ8_PLEPL|nr:unnamed protein product [Pleuronectes platessa]
MNPERPPPRWNRKPHQTEQTSPVSKDTPALRSRVRSTEPLDTLSIESVPRVHQTPDTVRRRSPFSSGSELWGPEEPSLEEALHTRNLFSGVHVELVTRTDLIPERCGAPSVTEKPNGSWCDVKRPHDSEAGDDPTGLVELLGPLLPLAAPGSVHRPLAICSDPVRPRRTCENRLWISVLIRRLRPAQSRTDALWRIWNLSIRRFGFWFAPVRNQKDPLIVGPCSSPLSRYTHTGVNSQQGRPSDSQQRVHEAEIRFINQF